MAYDNNVHGVVNVARHEGTINGTAHTMVMVYKNGGGQDACDNGTLVTIGNYAQLDATISPNYEIYRSTRSSVSTSGDIKTVAIVSAPELIYDEEHHYNLENFYNEAGKPVRAYFLKNNSVMGLSKMAFSNPNAVEVGKDVYLAGKDKLTVGTDSEISDSGVKVGHIESAYIYEYITIYNVRFQTQID